jgi:hypothetical protein
MLKTDEDSSAPTKKIKTLYELYQLSQLIDEATRVTMTTSSLIDHIVTNKPEKNSDSGVIHIGLKGHSTPRTCVAHKKGLYEPTLE